MNDMERGYKIKLARKAKGMSQSDLGEAIGRKQSTISNIETGKSRLDVKLLDEICEVLGMACQELDIEAQEVVKVTKSPSDIAKDPKVQQAVLLELLSNVIHAEEEA